MIPAAAKAAALFSLDELGHTRYDVWENPSIFTKMFINRSLRVHTFFIPFF